MSQKIRHCGIFCILYYASVTTTYLGLGSNLGDRKRNLEKALASLAPEIRIAKQSSTYRTKPMYVEDQPGFLNMVAQGETQLTAEGTLRKIKSVEKEMGEHVHNQPRTIDIDLILYGDRRLETAKLVVPHPKYRERDFVLQPLVDIDPGIKDPVTGKTVRELLNELPEDKRTIIGRA